jgi:hypothetical protein
MADRLPLLACQQRLFLVWIIGCAPSLLMMTFRTVTRQFDGQEQAVWSWFVPTFLPTLTLIIGAYSATARKAPSSDLTVDKLFYKVSVWCSVLYLFVLAGIIVMQPVLGDTVLGTFQRGSFALGVLQAITSACLGVFFVSHGKSPD